MLDIRTPLDVALDAWPMLGRLLRRHDESWGATKRKDVACRPDTTRRRDGIP